MQHRAYGSAIQGRPPQSRVVSSIRAFEYNMTAQWYQGYSTGKMEKLILDGIAVRLLSKNIPTQEAPGAEAKQE
jgi:hypothetical protein